MDTKLLRTFIDVAITRHFGQSADNLCLTQSAVSFRIKQLEELLGTPLFVRQRNNITLTAAGERLIPHAENILASWQLALQDVGVSEAHAAQLTLGGTSNLWDAFLQSLLPRLADQIPGLFLRTEINPQPELIRSLTAGRLDLAVMLDPPRVSELQTAKIGEIELALVCRTEGICIETVSDIGYVFVDWGTEFNMQHARLLKAPIAPMLHTGQSQIALEFILSHGGAAFLPLRLIETYVNDGQLHPVANTPTARRDIYLVFRAGSAQQTQIHNVMDQLTLLGQADLSSSRKAYQKPDSRRKKAPNASHS